MSLDKPWWLLILLIIGSCEDKTAESSETPGGKQIFHLLESDKTGIDFTNEVVDGENFNILTYRNFYNGGGVAIGDINNDSLPDLYFTANQSVAATPDSKAISENSACPLFR